MDFIPFEKVSLQEAKAVLDRNKETPVREKNWGAIREATAPRNTEITEQAWKWLESLPQQVQPGSILQRFPRILNKIAELWPRPAQCEKYLDALILDHRGSRKGFPPDVAKEIALLKTHLNPPMAKPRIDIWGERIGS